MNNFVFTPANVKDPMNHPRRIYFSCHPHDMEHFDTICEQIRAIEEDCVIAYAYADGDEDSRINELDNFHLIVVPVTKKWFTEGAHTREFAYLTANNKAVLPILFSDSFEERFNQVTSNLQFLRLNDPDFGEKLRRTLQDILFDSKLLEKVRSVFTHKMFIAYCREDADKVIRLIRAIHSVNAGRRISIWYDKYLPFGKNFETSIFDELDSSNFFVVTLTPNLLNRDNYVKENEYPHAQATGKKIVFLEFGDIDKEDLFKQLEQAENCDYASIDDSAFPSFLRRLIKEITGVNGQISNADLDFHLALAYQNGLFVEFDYQYAMQRFKCAANANNADAAHSLANMYYYGLGVSRDVAKAINWYKKEVRIAKEKLKAEVEKLRGLMQIKVNSNEVEEILTPIVKQIHSVTSDFIARCCNNARVLFTEGMMDDAEQLYNTVLKMLDLLNRESGKLAFGDIYRGRVENELNQLRLVNGKWDGDGYQKTWADSLKEYNNNPNDYMSVHKLLKSAHNYGTQLLTQKCCEKARGILLQALAIMDTINDPYISEDRSIYELIILLQRDIGNSYIDYSLPENQRADNAQEALRRFEISCSLLDNAPFDLKENPYLHMLKPWCLFSIGEAYKYIGDCGNSYINYVQALKQANDIETRLGDKAKSSDFPVFFLQLYSCCIDRLTNYEFDSEEKAGFSTLANILLERYRGITFVGKHKELADDYFEIIEAALKEWST